MSDFNQIWSLSTDFLRSPQYKISRRSVQWDPPEPHGQIVGRTDMTKPEDACCYLCESTYKEELLDKKTGTNEDHNTRMRALRSCNLKLSKHGLQNYLPLDRQSLASYQTSR